MADPFQLSVQYQDRLNRSTEALDRLPDSFMAGMKIPGIQAQNRILKNQAIESDQRISANDQMLKMMGDPGGFARQFGNLSTPKEMRKFMADHAAIVISPLGEKMMNGFDRIATATEEAEIHSIGKQLELATAKKRAEFLAGAIEAGIDIKDADAVRNYTINQNKVRSLAEFVKRANAAGLNPYSVQFGSDAYDELGNLDPDVERMMLGQAAPSQRLVIQQEIAQDRTTAQTAIANIRAEAQKAGKGYAPSQVERKILEAERHGVPFTQEEIHDMLRISAGTMAQVVNTKTKAAFIDSKLGTFMRADEANGTNRSDKERVEYLRGLYDEVYGKPVEVKAAPKSGGSKTLKWNDQTGELTE